MLGFETLRPGTRRSLWKLRCAGSVRCGPNTSWLGAPRGLQGALCEAKMLQQATEDVEEDILQARVEPSMC